MRAARANVPSTNVDHDEKKSTKQRVEMDHTEGSRKKKKQDDPRMDLDDKQSESRRLQRVQDDSTDELRAPEETPMVGVRVALHNFRLTPAVVLPSSS